jgi:predicted nucleotidyltransferase
MSIEEVLKKCKSTLQDHYGSQFKGLILYGSTANGYGGPSSDIDLLVLLDSPFEYFHELRRIVEMLYPIQLETDRLISAKPAPAADFESGTVRFYRNARRDGVFV